MVQIAAATIDVLVGLTAVFLSMARRASAPLFCFAGLTVLGVLTLELAASGGPTWLAIVGSASCAAVFAAWLGTLRAAGGSDGREGGGGMSGDPTTPPPGGDDEPWWWEEFERDLRAYARRQAIPPRKQRRPAGIRRMRVSRSIGIRKTLPR